MSQDFNDDDVFRGMMANSQMHMKKTDFTRNLMVKIEEQHFAKQQKQFYLKWTFVILLLESVIGFLLWLYHASGRKFTELHWFLIEIFQTALIWMFYHQYFILPFIILLGAKLWWESSRRIVRRT